MLNKKYCVNTDKITWRIIDQEAVILNLDSGFYYSLNKIGTLIWQALVEEKDLNQTLKIVSQNCQVPEKIIKNDVNSLINDLKKEKLVGVKI